MKIEELERLQNNNLGTKWCLPFGETHVMNHGSHKNMIYINNTFGEPSDTFINPAIILEQAISIGAIIPDKVSVECKCKRRIEGRYIELVKIVEKIKEEISK